MKSVVSGAIRGAIAGAAGATAVNLTTYADMVLRGRPASTAPSQLIEKEIAQIGVRLPDDERGSNRLSGLSGFSGQLVGVLVGAADGALRGAGLRLPGVVHAMLLGGAVMAVADVPLARSGVSDPKTWGVSGWLSDAIPHLAYGAVTAAAIGMLLPKRPGPTR